MASQHEGVPFLRPLRWIEADVQLGRRIVRNEGPRRRGKVLPPLRIVRDHFQAMRPVRQRRRLDLQTARPLLVLGLIVEADRNDARPACWLEADSGFYRPAL